MHGRKTPARPESPPPRGRGGGLGAALFRLLGLAVLAASIGLGWLWHAWRTAVEAPLDVPEAGLVYTIPQGARASDVYRDLADRGVLEHPLLLELDARRRGLAHRIKAGELRIPPGTTGGGLIQVLVAGRTIQYGLTIVEGWTFREMLDAVRASEVLEHVLEGLGPREIMARLGHPDQHPEGRFLPETYHFPRGTTDREFLERAHRAMADTLAAEWEGRAPDLPLETPYEALILASIVERETGLPEERDRVAGVFVRRLEKGMRLQTDPTVIYGLGDAFDGNLRRRDLRRDTPYNTYTRAGLPPTPIALPSRASIHAALHPERRGELYFVSTGDGEHVFSRTYEEHRKAVRKYQLGGGE